MRLICNSNTKRYTIVKLIKKVMIDRDMKVVDMARKIDQTERSAGNLLNPNYRSESSMTIDQLAMICDAMDCKLIIDIVPNEKVSERDLLKQQFMDYQNEYDDQLPERLESALKIIRENMNKYNNNGDE